MNQCGAMHCVLALRRRSLAACVLYPWLMLANVRAQESATLFLQQYDADKAAKLSATGASRAQALALYYKGLRWHRAGEDAYALKAFQQALAIDPTNVLLVDKTARLLAGIGKLNDAMTLLEKCLAQNGDQSAAWLAISRHCLSFHNNTSEVKSKALAYAQQAVDKFPSDWRVYLHMQSVLYKLEDSPAKKVEALAQKARAQPVGNNPAFWLRLTDLARNAYPLDDSATREKNLEFNLTFIRNALASAPQDPIAREETADWFAKFAGEFKLLSLYQEALPLYGKVAADHPENLDVRRKLARVQRTLGMEAEAEQEFSALLRINPQDLESHRALAEILERKGDKKGVIRSRQEILKWSGGGREDYHSLARAMLDEKMNAEAVTLLKRAVYMLPGDPFAIANLADILAATGRYDEAVNTYEDASALAGKIEAARIEKERARLRKSAKPGSVEKPVPPDKSSLLQNPTFYLFWGQAAQAAAKITQAEELFRKAIESAPKNQQALAAPAYNALGRMWLDSDKNIDEAGELIRIANQLSENNPAYLDSLGWFHFKKQNYEEAITELTKADGLALEPDAGILDHLAQALGAAGKKDDAIKHLEKAAALPTATAAMKARLEQFKKPAAPPKATP